MPPRPSLESAVTELAPQHFAEFGYRAVTRVDTTVAEDYEVELDRCVVHFYWHHGGLGSYLRPREGSRYVIHYGGDEVPFPRDEQHLRDEIEKQMRLIVEKFVRYSKVT